MKIAILTFQHALNYGAVLQAFALQSVIEEMGHTVNVLDYACPFLDNRKYIKKKETVIDKSRALVKNAIIGRDLRRRERRFREFEYSWLSLSEKCNFATLPKIAEDYDALIVGSDQVWNLSMTGGDTGYFFDFDSPNPRRISYAASLGQDHVLQEDLVAISALLERFNSISVREASASKALSSVLFDKQVECVLDPTLILPGDKWNAVTDGIDIPHHPYVFVYALGEMERLERAAKEVAKERGLEIVCQSTGLRGIRGAHNVHDMGPKEFLAHIKGADYVIGSSFHGFCLSLVFGKEFSFVLSRTDGRNGRLLDLAKMLGLENRMIDEGANPPMRPIDYTSVLQRLETERQKSLNYIYKALS